MKEKQQPIDSSRHLYSKLCSFHNTLCNKIMALSNVFVWSLYHDYEWPDIPHRALRLYLELFSDELSDIGQCYVADECYNIIHEGDKHKNLTLKYYAQKVYYYVKMELSQPLLLPRSSQTEFNILEAARTLATLIPMTERLNQEKMEEDLNFIYSEIDEKIKQYRPDLLENCLRKQRKQIGGVHVWNFSKSENIFIMKEIHNCIHHDMKFKETSSLSLYNGHNYCLDKLLSKKQGNAKLISVLEAVVAQHYGISCELIAAKNKWRVSFEDKEGEKSSYTCPECHQDISIDEFSPLSEDEFFRYLVEDLVKKFESELGK